MLLRTTDPFRELDRLTDVVHRDEVALALSVGATLRVCPLTEEHHVDLAALRSFYRPEMAYDPRGFAPDGALDEGR